MLQAETVMIGTVKCWGTIRWRYVRELPGSCAVSFRCDWGAISDAESDGCRAVFTLIRHSVDGAELPPGESVDAVPQPDGSVRLYVTEIVEQ